ncbi:uncharacterized protein EDB91DRAFT_1086887 [Suillus paluster]|uniref:uncharacterized protein n=1 Tax=Suillus paluster TaxID=48578 RepID=UPI001B8784DF|nr:uncharacterized protein EDB91DRAFT_1086887 [Suillus paluster]KAG1726066.1 hypothetical protein EDB91DRAFT_1086887 [Suillus paluster]
MPLPELLCFAQACCAVRFSALDIITKRYQVILGPYVPQRLEKFNKLLTNTCGIITGSCAINMLLGTPQYLTRDLNLVVPCGGWSLMENFILDDLHYTPTSTSIHPIMKNQYRRFKAYTKHVRPWDALQPIAEAPSTIDMTMMTPGGIVTFYPEMTLDWIRYSTHKGDELQLGQHLGSKGSNRFRIERSTAFLRHMCGANCPTLWQNMRNHKEYLALDWDARFTVKRAITNSDLEWCMATMTTNQQHLRKTVPIIPNAETEPDHIYTFFFESANTSPPPNSLTDEIVRPRRRTIQHNGNLLVIKSKRGDRREISNMTTEDISLMTYIVKVVTKLTNKRVLEDLCLNKEPDYLPKKRKGNNHAFFMVRVTASKEIEAETINKSGYAMEHYLIYLQ